MKLQLVWFVLFMNFVFCSCDLFKQDENDEPNDKSSEVIFLASTYTTPPESWRDKADMISKIVVDESTKSVEIIDECEYIVSHYNTPSTMFNGTLKNGRYAYVADNSSFDDQNYHFLYFDVADDEVIMCPEPDLFSEDDLSPSSNSFKSPRIDDSGRIFYVISYHHEYMDYHNTVIIRYDPENETYDYTKGAEGFVLSQTEIGNDTENGNFKGDFEISNDGRYVYTVVYGYGTDMGSYHDDYHFLVRYDFETDQFKRYDKANWGVNILGISTDGNTLYYSLDGRKTIDLQTNEITVCENMPYSEIDGNAMNSSGYCLSATTGIYYYSPTTDEEIKVVSAYDTESAQFDEKGNLFFLIEGNNENYICKKPDLELVENWDTIATIPSSIGYVLLSR